MNKSTTIPTILTIAVLAGHACTENEQATGVDFAVSKENVKEDVLDNARVYSPYVGQSYPDRVF